MPKSAADTLRELYDAYHQLLVVQSNALEKIRTLPGQFSVFMEFYSKTTEDFMFMQRQRFGFVERAVSLSTKINGLKHDLNAISNDNKEETLKKLSDISEEHKTYQDKIDNISKEIDQAEAKHAWLREEFEFTYKNVVSLGEIKIEDEKSISADEFNNYFDHLRDYFHREGRIKEIQAQIGDLHAEYKIRASSPESEKVRKSISDIQEKKDTPQQDKNNFIEKQTLILNYLDVVSYGKDLIGPINEKIAEKRIAVIGHHRANLYEKYCKTAEERLAFLDNISYIDNFRKGQMTFVELQHLFDDRKEKIQKKQEDYLNFLPEYVKQYLKDTDHIKGERRWSAFFKTDTEAQVIAISEFLNKSFQPSEAEADI